MNTKQSRLLVIVPCGQSKVWDNHPDAGPTAAAEAYYGSPFKVNREFAKHFGDSWIILSAKYGFISPDVELPGPYEVTFKKKASGPVSMETLRWQVKTKGLDQFTDIIGLGGKEYRAAIEAAFSHKLADLHFPFAGLRIGEAMQAVKQSIARNRAFGESGRLG